MSKRFQLEDHAIDEVRDIKVAVIGAGLAGISAGVLLPVKVPGLDLRIYDKNVDVGGTWFENTYPGVRCDVPAHAYQSGFSPKIDWTEEYAQGEEIKEYWQGLARKHDVYKYLRLGQRIDKAEWLPDVAKWELTITDLIRSEGPKSYVEHLDFIILATGLFNQWRLPTYPGMDQFQGRLFHSSNWDHNVDIKGQKVALIGNGASGLQVLPGLQPIASHVDHYARNRTWVVDSFAGGIRTVEPNYFSNDQVESFKDPETYLKYRRSIETVFYRRFNVILKDSEENKKLRETTIASMMKRIAHNPEYADKIIPDFPLNCRRPTPGPGYLEALVKENVSYIQTPISHFTKTGMVTTDGVERDADIVICATGANMTYSPPFPLIAHGMDLREAWRPDGLLKYPQLYLGLAAPGFPNLFWVGGPYMIGWGGTVPNLTENSITYIAKVLRKFRSQGIKTMTPSREATNDFLAYSRSFYDRTVWTGNDDTSADSKNCSSWYNGGVPNGPIVGQFPGSASHVNYVRREPRWEDYEYTYLNASNRFAYFGNGQTIRDTADGHDWTPYLKLPKDIDLRTYHEGWWDV